MCQITIRDLMLATVIVALCLGWAGDRHEKASGGWHCFLCATVAPRDSGNFRRALHHPQAASGIGQDWASGNKLVSESISMARARTRPAGA
jgi:hypothetical protein